MNDSEIDRVVDELKGLVGTSFSNVWQPRRDRVVLGLGGGLLLLLHPRGPFARLHLVNERPSNPQKPYSFQGACRAHLQGPLLAIDRIADDRVVRIRFAEGRLELRLTGRSGGLWLLDDGKVLAAHDGPAPEQLPPLPVRGSHTLAPTRFEPLAEESWNQAASRYFAEAEAVQDRQHRRARARIALTRALARNERLLANLADDLGKADEAPSIRHRADLLAANLYRVQRSDRYVIVENWENGDSVTIDLDPTKTPAAQLERMYHQAKRLERMADQVLARMDQVEHEQRWMRQALATVDDLDVAGLNELEPRLPRNVEPSREPNAARPAPGHVTWVGPGGQRVLIGKNARGNRVLTFQVARGRDWWMHLRGRPGAHVVIPMAEDKPPPLPLLLAAAQIALLAARVAPGEVMEIQYTRVRNVRAIRGADGLVTVHDERVLRVTRDPAVLAGWAAADVS